MQRPLLKFSFHLILAFVIFFNSCDNCGHCPEDTLLSDELKNSVQLGDSLKFISSIGDTLMFTCTNVLIEEQYGSLDSKTI